MHNIFFILLILSLSHYICLYYIISLFIFNLFIFFTVFANRTLFQLKNSIMWKWDLVLNSKHFDVFFSNCILVPKLKVCRLLKLKSNAEKLFFLKTLQSATLLKRGFSTVVFMRILRNVAEQIFYGIPANACFYELEAMSNKLKEKTHFKTWNKILTLDFSFTLV